MRRQQFRRTFVLLAVILSFSAAMPMADTAAKPGNGNSENAKACQKGGWATLAPQESPSVAFQSQDECVSYGANGSTLAPHTPLPPHISIGMTPAGGLCVPSILATGFAPNVNYSYTLYINNLDVITTHGSGTVTADDDGEISLRGPSFVRSPGVSFGADIGGFSSDWVPYVC
jgi:hypothetical protein